MSATGKPSINETGGSAGNVGGGIIWRTSILGTPTVLVLMLLISGMGSKRCAANQLQAEHNRNGKGSPVAYTVMLGRSAEASLDKINEDPMINTRMVFERYLKD